MKKNVVIISNRLPVKMKISDGQVVISQSEGGLATGLKSFHRNGKSLWFGWNGLFDDEIPENLCSEIASKLQEKKCKAVALSQKEIEGYYDGFSNKALWPLFHYFPEYAKFELSEWTAYKEVNLKFAKTVLPHLKNNVLVWIHDYQLLLVANFLRQSGRPLKIGFFNHIPFPSYEVFRLLPWREEILIGMLGADLIGFHTAAYKAHFLQSVERILKIPVSGSTIKAENRVVRTGVFPMEIDFEKFNNTKNNNGKSGEKPRVFYFQTEEKSKRTKFILSVDRLDYTKGIANRLQAFAYFLKKYPQFQKKVRLLMLAVPSRTHVPQYQVLKKEVDELVGRINGTFSDLGWTPIWYFFRAFPFDKLIDLYRNSDLCFINPLRDGMNLVAKEYLAARSDETGVLVLSEMAGAAQELTEALIVNPYNFDEISDILKMALEMPLEEQRRRNKISRTYLKNHTVQQWAQHFLNELQKTEQKPDGPEKISLQIEKEILQKFHLAKKPILFLDYDGTLVDFKNDPQMAMPDQELLATLNKIAQNQQITLFLISGRDKASLENWFGKTPVNLIAEHGVWNKVRPKTWELSQKTNADWKAKVLPVFKDFENRFQGSFTEEKNFSVAWHYRKVRTEVPVKKLIEELEQNIQEKPLKILNGNKVLEITDRRISKGTAALQYAKKGDFVLAMGDDATDELLFQALPENAVTIKIGTAKTCAKFSLKNVKSARNFLEGFVPKQKMKA